jgi:MerR family transcriptional regulator, light-induced transcriptional regulator
VSTYSIKDLEQLSGIKAHTLRIWEQRYNFIKPKRTGTNIRFYDDNDLKLVLNISLLKDNGHKISKISRMCSEEMQHEVIKLTEERLTTPEQMHALTIAMIECDEHRFEKIMSMNVKLYGLERTMIDLIYPFLNKVGIMWQTGSVYPFHEHFITNLVRQKLIVAIDDIPSPVDGYKKKFLLYLPEGELHELSLLFSHYLLKARQCKVIYLGPNLPVNDIQSIYQKQEPDYVLTVITAYPQAQQIQAYLNQISVEFTKTWILVTGRQVIDQHIQLPVNMSVLKNYKDLIDLIKIE